MSPHGRSPQTGAHVVLAARNVEALADAEAWVHAEVPHAKTSTVPFDLTSLADVRGAAEAIASIAPAVHVLMNNAGVMFTPFGRTSDGFEIQFGTNHLGHFDLTRLLTPQLVAAGGARIVILSSDGHRMSDIDLDDPNWERRDYDKFAAYGAAKTANVLHMVELDRRLRDHGVRAYAVHPGVVATSLARHMSRDDFTTLTQFEPEDPTAREDRRAPRLHDARAGRRHPGVGGSQSAVGRHRLGVPGRLRDSRRRRTVRSGQRPRLGVVGAL